MASSLLSTFLILSSLLAFTFADESNVLLTGEILATDGQLSYRGVSFVMQDDCNLVLYNDKGVGFSAGTHAAGINCTLTLDDQGQLIIRSADQSTVWTSGVPANAKKGKYAAVLRPDGQVVIYGPAVWTATPPLNSNAAPAAAYGAELATIPLVRNVLFSSQILYDNARLTSRDYTFVMLDDCNLVLIKAATVGAKWMSYTSGKGQHCFLRLSHRGQLAVVTDGYKTVWSSKPAGKISGDYVLVLQINGQAVVYGPSVWSTSN